MTFSLEDALVHAQKLADRGETEKARQLYRIILERQPDRTEAREALAGLETRSARLAALSALLEKSDFAAVIEQDERLTEQFPTSVILHNLLGIAYANLGQHEPARRHFSSALSVRPDMAQIHVNLGKSLSKADKAEEAAMSFRQALALRPDYADAHFSLGIALGLLGRHEEAANHFFQVLRLQPNSVEAEINLGSALRDLGRTDEAIACFNRALKLDPRKEDAYIRLAMIHNREKRYPEAITALDAILNIAPERSDARAAWLFLASMLCDWDRLAREAETIRGLGIAGKAVQPFMLLALDDDPARNRTRAERLTQEHYTLPELAPMARPSVRPSRLRLGYFSADFHDHAVLRQLIRVLELHDRDAFEVHAYSYGPASEDAMRKRVHKAVDQFHDVRDRNGKDIARLARQDRIDIAIDLMGYTRNGRPEIFASRAAPVQIAYLGYPGTMGAAFMDYLIADRIIITADQREHYAEKVIFLPDAHMATDNTKAATEGVITRRDLNLPEAGFVFCCFNNSYKISPEDFDIWMRLLHKVQGSVLWLAGLGDLTRENLSREASRHGIDPSRLIVSPVAAMHDHLARQRLADLFLDTGHYTGHATAADALWSGLPILTRPGRGFHTRVAASLLTAIGLPELIAETAEDYERLASELAQDPGKLAALRQRLERNRAHMPLFDTERFTKNLEDGYRQAYRRWFEGAPPEDISAGNPL